MTDEKTSQRAKLHEETRRIWDQKAVFWDERMGDGNEFQRLLISPVFRLACCWMGWKNQRSILLMMAHSRVTY